MKKILLLLPALIILSFISCEEENEFSIEGTWAVAPSEHEWYTDCELNTTFTFDNNILYIDDYYDEYYSEYDQNTDTIIEYFDCINEPYSVTYFFSEEFITIDNEHLWYTINGDTINISDLILIRI